MQLSIPLLNRDRNAAKPVSGSRRIKKL